MEYKKLDLLNEKVEIHITEAELNQIQSEIGILKEGNEALYFHFVGEDPPEDGSFMMLTIKDFPKQIDCEILDYFDSEALEILDFMYESKKVGEIINSCLYQLQRKTKEVLKWINK